MDSQQIQKLKKLGINTDRNTIDIFEDLINVAIYLYDELEIKEEYRLRIEINRVTKKSTN